MKLNNQLKNVGKGANTKEEEKETTNEKLSKGDRDNKYKRRKNTNEWKKISFKRRERLKFDYLEK